MSEGTLFGAPLAYDPNSRDKWINTLTRDWRAQMKQRLGPLSDDLNDLAPLFATGAKPKVLRDRVHSLRAADNESKRLPSAVTLIIDGCALVTPEGRILLEVLRELQWRGQTRIDLDAQIRALDTAVTLRAQWHATWLRKQFEGSLSAPALGAAMFLLLNGSIGEDRALLLPADDQRDRELGALILPLIARFSDDLGGREPETSGGIRQHWAFTQVSRLLGRAVDRSAVPDGTITFVRDGQATVLINELAQRLAKAVPDPHRRRQAILGLVEGYRAIRGVLAALGVMHEDPTATRRLLTELAGPGAMP